MEKIQNLLFKTFRRNAAPTLPFDVKLDMRGYHCPKPVISTKAALNKMQSGQTLLVLATDPSSQPDITGLLSRSGDELLQTESTDGEFRYWIKKS